MIAGRIRLASRIHRTPPSSSRENEELTYADALVLPGRVMIAIYVLLDGFDLGVGIVHLGVAHTDAERRAVLSTIGPVWDANEVWLIASGGVLFFAFPVFVRFQFQRILFAADDGALASDSARRIRRIPKPRFRAALGAVLGCCVLSVERAAGYFLWRGVGNVVRGVPLDAQGYFFEPLWTNFRLGEDTGILDWYTILVGLAAYLARRNMARCGLRTKPKAKSASGRGASQKLAGGALRFSRRSLR